MVTSKSSCGSPNVSIKFSPEPTMITLSLFQDMTPESLFAPDLCRPIHFNFKEETQVNSCGESIEKVPMQVLGVPGYKYQVGEDVMANGTFNENNICFNPNPDLLVDLPIDCTSQDQCTTDPPEFHPLKDAVNMNLPNGLLNVTTCTFSKYASPTYVSHPHFYLADPNLLSQFHPESDLVPNGRGSIPHILSFIRRQGPLLRLPSGHR